MLNYIIHICTGVYLAIILAIDIAKWLQKLISVKPVFVLDLNNSPILHYIKIYLILIMGWLSVSIYAAMYVS